MKKSSLIYIYIYIVLSIFAVVLLFNFNITSKYEFHNNIISANLNLKKEYYITYNLDGGTHSNPIKYNINSVPFTLKAPSKAGYTFLGWTGSNGTTPQTEVTITKDNLNDLNYIANWTVNTYTIKFNGNGSTDGTTANETMTYDVTKNLTANGFTRTGYTFKCWNTKADGTGTSYINSQSVKNLATSGTFNLYAIWIPTNYTITYNLTGGTVTGNPTSYNIETANITLKSPTRTGYTFAGWTGSNGTTKQTAVTIPKGSTGNRTYTAQWTANSINATFNGNGGTIAKNGTQTFTSGKGQKFADTGVTRTGYTLLGWSENKSATTAQYSTLSAVSDNWIGNGGTKTLYAIWKINTYKVDVNTYVEGTKYTSGKSGFTFKIYKNNTLVGNNVIDWCQNVEYGSTIKVVMNSVNGYAMEKQTITKTIGTSNVEINPKWFKYKGVTLVDYAKGQTQAKPLTFYTFDTSTGIYNITQNANTYGWGPGTVYDGTNIQTPWGRTYVLHFEIKTSTDKILNIDPNNRPHPSSDFSLNDYFKSVTLTFDGTKTSYSNLNGKYTPVGTETRNGITVYSLPDKMISRTITKNTWHTIEMEVPNNHPINTKHTATDNFTAFGFSLENYNSNFTYQVRNIYGYNK